MRYACDAGRVDAVKPNLGLEAIESMATSPNKTLKVAAAIAVSFTTLGVAIMVLLVKRIVSFQLAMLMLIALVGLYFGFGTLIAIYRFTGKLK